MNIQWIVFDLGGVVVEIDEGSIYRELAKLSSEAAAEIKSRVTEAGLWAEMRVGKMSEASLFLALERIIGRKAPEEDLRRCVNAELKGEIRPMVALIEALSTRHKLACLSNTNSIHWGFMLQNYPVFDRFHMKLASQQLGLEKPHREIYDAGARELGARPGDCLFIDDRIENVRGALDAGWQAWHYQDFGEFMGALRAAGIEA
jgi:putative hydrolase of the HAD superfamily